jgi:hypothetical protein
MDLRPREIADLRRSANHPARILKHFAEVPEFSGTWSPLTDKELAKLLETVCASLRGRYPWIDSQLIYDATIDELLHCFRKPDRQAIADRGNFAQVLFQRARRRLGNCLRTDERRRLREQSWAALQDTSSVELHDSAENSSIEDWVAMAKGVANNPEELKCLSLLLQGERRTSVFADALGFANDGSAHMLNQIKRIKDRLKIRLKRHWKEDLEVRRERGEAPILKASAPKPPDPRVGKS